jgi:hypothetical protein
MKQTAGVILYYGVLMLYQRILRHKSNNSSPKATKQSSYTPCFSRRNRLYSRRLHFACSEYVVPSFISSLHLFYRSCLFFFSPVLFTCFGAGFGLFFNSQIPQTAIRLPSTHLVLGLLFSHVFAFTNQSLASCCSFLSWFPR